MSQRVSASLSPSPQNLAPKKLECYCKFVENNIEAVPVSALNAEAAFIEKSEKEASEGRRGATQWSDAIRNGGNLIIILVYMPNHVYSCTTADG